MTGQALPIQNHSSTMAKRKRTSSKKLPCTAELRTSTVSSASADERWSNEDPVGGTNAGSKTADTPEVLPNPLLEKQQAFLRGLTELERDSFFSSQLDPDRRAELWMEQADLGESLVNAHAWATPDDRALRILYFFSPIIEIGCGAQAYWCTLMRQSGIDVIGFDVRPSIGGTINKRSVSHRQFNVLHGGSEVLRLPEHAGRTLFLCYPDENDNEVDGSGGSEVASQESLALSCLANYGGDYVIHVGELFADTTLAMDQAPWGRSTSPEFQQQLAAQYHCLLRVGLSSWLHVRDTLSVWKRSEACPIVFSGEHDDGEDECIYYRHVPLHERLPTDIVAPCLAHLLHPEASQSKRESVHSESKEQTELGKKQKRHPLQRKGAASHSSTGKDPSLYSTPW